MLPNGTIEASQVWKRFRADRQRMLLRDEIERLRNRMRGRSDRGWRWALSDVSLKAEPGESIGLIGTNGSGKTTLLRVLARVMYPYAGNVDVLGRVGALIEVRAGIHPDLSGRENVYLMGSLLGLKRKEVAERFDEIVAFAELEDAIDRQVKFYSSGMSMRLGFGVAAFLEPDVLLVDEVLAVGDASFQQKCLERMRHVLAQGTTLIFVSHDLAAVEATCERGVWLRDGMVEAAGKVADVVTSYRGFIEEAAEASFTSTGDLRLLKAEVVGSNGTMPRTQGTLSCRLVVESDRSRAATLFVGVSQGPATPIFALRRELGLAEGETDIGWDIARLPLPHGRFYLWASITDVTDRELLPWQPVTRFSVSGPRLDRGPRGIVRPSPVHVEAAWRESPNGNRS